MKVLRGGTLDDALADLPKLTRGEYEKLILKLKTNADDIKKTFLDKLSEFKEVRNKLSINEPRLISLRKNRPKDPDKVYHWEEAVNNFEDLISDHIKQYKKLERELTSANNFIKILDQEGPEQAIKFLDTNPKLAVDFPRLSDWKNKASMDLVQWHDKFRSQSFNLGKAKKFLLEYGQIMSRPKDDPYRMAFLSNTENQNYLSALRGTRSRKLINLIRKIESPETAPKASLIGPITDVAKKLGVGSALVGAGIGAVKLFEWLNKSSRDGVNEANDILTILNDIEASGQGLNILNNTKKSVSKIRLLSDQLDDDLNTDPEKAAKTYLNGVAQEVTNLTNSLNQWNTVVKFSDDPNKAKLAGEEIEQYINRAQQNFAKLGAQMGQPMSTKQVNYTAPSNKEVQKIQEVLRQRGYNIPVSGEVDNATISALESLEREYQSKAPNYDLSGAFINKQTGNIVSYNDLIDALNILEK